MGARPTVVLELDNDTKLARDLAAGGVFVPGCTIAVFEDCELVVRGADTELTLAARVVFVDANGAGLELVDCAPEVMAQLAAMGKAATVDDDEAGEDVERRKIARNVHERLRGLTLVQQIKAAQHGEISERMVLERIYGKTVWDPLLRNPRITGPEVARIARMGALPRPLVELIVGNGAWLQIPEIRRALLTNPRMGTDQIIRVLRLLPKHELKLATIQTSYSQAVREQAKRILRELD
jgi:hypothetical protein